MKNNNPPGEYPQNYYNSMNGNIIMGTRTVARLIVFWALYLTGMILHSLYHLSKLFYGAPVARPGASGVVPFIAVVMKTVFFVFPMVFILALVFLRAQWFRRLHLGISVLYAGYAAFNFSKEFSKNSLDIAQVILLGFVMVLSFFLVYSAFRWTKIEDDSDPGQMSGESGNVVFTDF